MARGTHEPSPATYQDLVDDSGLPSFVDLNLLAEGGSWFSSLTNPSAQAARDAPNP